MATHPLRWLFSHDRSSGDHVDYFRHVDGRCVAVVNGGPKQDHGEISSPHVVMHFDRLEINGGPAAAQILDQLTDVVFDALDAAWQKSAYEVRA